MTYGPLLTRESELAVQEEVTYATSPGALAGGDFFKHKSLPQVTREVARYDRDKDRDSSPSVLATQVGRQSSKLSIECDLIPAGASTPTEPDVNLLIKAGFGTRLIGTAHTTTAAGSTGTTLELTAGGGAASGIAVGQLIAVDVSATFGYEVRQVTAISTDTVTVDRAFSANPAVSRTVKVGVTYRLSASSVLSLYLWWFNGNDLRYVIPGFCVNQVGVSMDYTSLTPVAGITFGGEGSQEAAQTATSKPTPSTVGIPLLPTESKVWLGTSKYLVTAAAFNLANTLTLRNNQSGSLAPTGVKRTGNNSRFMADMSLTMLSLDTNEALYNAALTLTAYDSIVQMGITPGKIVAWRCPNWIPDVAGTEVDGEHAWTPSGRAYGVAGSDEVTLGFL